MVSIFLRIIKVNLLKNRVYKGHKHSANYILMLKPNFFLSISDDSTIKIWDLYKT